MDKDKRDFAKPRDRADAAFAKPLREVVAEVDQEILRLLTRRHNLLAKMRKNGHLDAGEEKFLRESWQNSVAKVSRDPNLSGRFFALMQQLGFLPKPGDSAKTQDQAASPARQAFNLAPAAGEVNFEMAGLVSGQLTCAWLYLAAASGQAMELANSLQNDAIVDCIRCLVEMGASVTRAGDNNVICRQGESIGAPDKVIYVGSSEFLFYILLAHYLGRPARVKFAGDEELALANFSVLSKIVPSLGGRITFSIPKTSGLPARVESPGMLPKCFAAGDDLPPLLAQALLLAAPFYEKPFALDLSQYRQKALVLSRVLPLYKACGVNFSQQAGIIGVIPGEIKIPPRPQLPLEPGIAVFLLGFCAIRGGSAKISGAWPDWPDANAAWQACAPDCWQKSNDCLTAACQSPLLNYTPERTGAAPGWLYPLQAAFCACAALKGGKSVLPKALLEDIDTQDFLRHAGVKSDADGNLEADAPSAGVWNAPTPSWALALALTACARKTVQGIPLGNPGIITELWPQFWSFYNSLPNPTLKKNQTGNTKPEKSRRRILTSVVAVPPAITEDDWD